MKFPAMVQPIHGEFEAALVGAPDVCATAATREEALAALESALAQRLERDELVAFEVRRRGLAGLFGKYRDAPTVREISESAYQARCRCGRRKAIFTDILSEILASNPA